MSPQARFGRGFTLVELMIVIAIIGILATMAVPSFQDRVIQAQVKEGLAVAGFVQQAVSERYARTHGFPRDNAAAGVPPADRIVGNYVSGIAVQDGAIDIVFGNQSNRFLAGRKLTLRPAIVEGYPAVPIAWVCGLAAVPDRMTARGSNGTTVPAAQLPLDCRPM